MKTNKFEQRIKELINDEVCMGTYGLVELELRELIKHVHNEAIKQAESNLELIQTTSEEINNKSVCEYSPWITADDETIWAINRKRISDLKIK